MTPPTYRRMIVLCPTCGGKGSIPDPKLQGQAMCYYNPHTGDSFPPATCRTCGGSGWVEQ